PRARLIVSETNLGFAKATNLGLSHARGELLLLLNPDTEIVGDALVQLAAFLRSRERAAAAGPSLRYADGTPQQAAFTFPTLWMSFLDFFPLHHRLLNSGLNGRYRAPTDGTPFRIGHPLGAAMLIKRSAIERIGPLDEQFFIYCEEVDWCIRAQRAGLDVYQVPSAVVVHHGGQSTGQFREAMLVELHRSRYQLFRKHYSPRFIAAHRLITRCGLLKEGAHARWQKATGKMSSEQLRSRLRAYSAIWGM
ncbi:MAG TPA: glycosyltransferase family 2 protein, partial [Chloroflexota bacterium]